MCLSPVVLPFQLRYVGKFLSQVNKDCPRITLMNANFSDFSCRSFRVNSRNSRAKTWSLQRTGRVLPCQEHVSRIDETAGVYILPEVRCWFGNPARYLKGDGDILLVGHTGEVHRALVRVGISVPFTVPKRFRT